MLRQGLVLLLSIVFFTLILIIGFALTGLSSPLRTVDQAEQALIDKDHAKAVELLTVALSDQGTLDDRDLTERALRLRVRAYEELGNYTDAMSDLDSLIKKYGVADRSLLLKRIELTLAKGKSRKDEVLITEAMSLAREQVAAIPKRQTAQEHRARAHALALVGRSARSIYDLLFEDLWDILLAELPRKDQKLSRELLQEVVARNADNQRGQQVLRRLHRLLPGKAARFGDRLALLRNWIQRAEASYLDALREDPGNADAFQGLARILQQRRDTTGLYAHGEVFLRCARKKDALAGALIVVRNHLRRGQHRAAFQLLERVIPVGGWTALATNELTAPHLTNLLLCKAIALDKLIHDDEVLRKSMSELAEQVLQIAGQREQKTYFGHLVQLVIGISLAPDQPQPATDFLRDFSWNAHILEEPVEEEWTLEELLRLAYAKRLELSKDLKESLDLQVALLKGWANKSKLDPSPRVELVRLLSKNGRAIEALTAAVEALDLAGRDETLLDLYANTAVLSAAGTDQELNRLLTRCRVLGTSVPDNVGDLPILLLPLAAHALKSGNTHICRGCATQVMASFPWAARPRLLRVEAALMEGDRTAALQDLEVLLKYHPNEMRVLPLLAKALQGDKEKNPRLRFVTALQGGTNAGFAAYLADGLLLQKRFAEAEKVATTALARFDLRGNIALPCFEARLALGWKKQAMELLSRMYRELRVADPPDPEMRKVLAAYVLYNPDKLDRPAHTELLLQYLDVTTDADEMYRLASSAAELKKYNLADRILDELFEQPRFAQKRRFEHYLLAAHSAMARDAVGSAGRYFTAALSFSKGQTVAADLVILALLREDPESARQVLATVPDTDPRAATLHTLLGNKDKGMALASKVLAADPSNLDALIVVAAVAEKAAVPAPLRELISKVRGETLLLSALAATEGLPKTTLQRADDMIGKQGKNGVLQILHARALIKTGGVGDVIPHLLGLEPRASLDPLLRTEAIRTIDRADPPELHDPRIRFQLFELCQALGGNTPPALLAMTFRVNMDLMIKPELRSKYVPVMSGLWLRGKTVGRPGLAEVRLLDRANDHVRALELLDKIEPKLAQNERAEAVRLRYVLTRKLLAAHPEKRLDYLAAARKQLSTLPIYGEPLHFVLDLTKDLWGGTTDTIADDMQLTKRERNFREEARTLMRLHVESFKSGADPNLPNLIRTLDKLGMHEIPEQSLERLDELLTHDPTNLELWMLRARWLSDAGRTREAERSLRWVLFYLPEPRVQNQLLDMIEDSVLLEDLANLKLTSEYGKGILLLRRGYPMEGLEHFRIAPARKDGSHLFMQVLALLSSNSENAEGQAREVLDRLITEYPGSPRTAMAKHLASLLQGKTQVAAAQK